MAKKNSNSLRCLSIRQPWAWLVCAGVKRIENRTWSTDYRGTIAIHASTTNSVVKDFVRNRVTELFSVDDFAYGAIIGFADIIDVQLFGREHESDSFACGPYCWQMANARLLNRPIPMQGKLNLFYLDDVIGSQLRNAESRVVDLSSASGEAQIASALAGEADPIGGYAYLLRELDGKIEDEELAWRAERMLELDPNEAEGNLCRLRFSLRSGRMATVRVDLDRLLKAFPEDPEVLDLCTTASLALCDYAGTIDIANRAHGLFSDLGWGVIFNRGVAKMELGIYDEALDDVSASLLQVTYPEDKALVYNYLARIQRRRKHYEEAEKAINFAILLQPAFANNYYVAASVAEHKGDKVAARNFAKQALEVDPNYSEAVDLLARL